MSGRFHDIRANGKERGIRPAQPVKPISCSLGLMDHPLELAACPANDIEIDPFQGWTQLRPVEVAVVADPAANDGNGYAHDPAEKPVFNAHSIPKVSFVKVFAADS